ncbi:hypothetical protein QBC42DRAFT_149666, partial [Cladorrhinum samala]
MERVDEGLKRKNQELESALEDKTQQFSRLQGLYDALRNTKSTADLEPANSAKFRTSTAGNVIRQTSYGPSGSRLPRSILPSTGRNNSGSYFPSEPDYPDAQNN